jgi:hypothetical protein
VAVLVEKHAGRKVADYAGSIAGIAGSNNFTAADTIEKATASIDEIVAITAREALSTCAAAAEQRIVEGCADYVINAGKCTGATPAASLAAVSALPACRSTVTPRRVAVADCSMAIAGDGVIATPPWISARSPTGPLNPH